MRQKITTLFFVFLTAIVVKADGIEIDSIRLSLIIDGGTAAHMVKQSEECMPSSLNKAASQRITLKDVDGENFRSVTTGTFKSTSFGNGDVPYSYTAELRQSEKNPNRFLITPFFKSEEGIIVEITSKKNDAGAYILKVVSASTGIEYPSYGMVCAEDANSFDGESEFSNFDGSTFRLNLRYFINNAGRFDGVYYETFEIPEGLVSYTEGIEDDLFKYWITDASSREVSVVRLKDTERTTIDIPESIEIDGVTYTVKSIGDEAFMYRPSLMSVTIPNTVISIGSFAFYGCTGLTSIDIPSSVTSIETGAFLECEGLTSVTIPNSVTTIGKGAFWSCSGLTKIYIPSSVTSIGSYAFSQCSGVTNIEVDAGNTVYDSRDNCNAIIETSSNTLVAGFNTTAFPSSVTSIGFSAFFRCSGLTSVTIPDLVTSIGEQVFSGCVDLTSIIIPASVTSIGYNAFYGCHGLTSVTALRTDPATYNCDGNVFYNSPISSATLHVPAGCADAYRAQSPWSNFGTITDDIETALVPVELNSNAATYYNPLGQQFKEAQRGVNIIRFSDGTTKKVLVK